MFSCRLSSEWHCVNPPADKVALRSKTKYLWTCSDCDLEFEAIPHNRSTYQSGCPECEKDAKWRRRAQYGLLKDEQSELADEYVAELNTSPFISLRYGSAYNASWRCRKCTALFTRMVWQRFRLNLGCPTCSREEKLVTIKPSYWRLMEAWVDYSPNIAYPTSDDIWLRISSTSCRKRALRQADAKIQIAAETHLWAV